MSLLNQVPTITKLYLYKLFLSQCGQMSVEDTTATAGSGWRWGRAWWTTAWTPRGYVGSAHLLLSHGSGAGGVCLGGARRCGQTALVPQMARVLGYKTKTINMYADITARDLLQ